MKEYGEKLAAAFLAMKKMHEVGELPGDSCDPDPTRSKVMENHLIHRVKRHCRIREEDAIDLVDELNILNVLITNSDGEFFFNEKMRYLGFSEAMELQHRISGL